MVIGIALFPNRGRPAKRALTAQKTKLELMQADAKKAV